METKQIQKIEMIDLISRFRRHAKLRKWNVTEVVKGEVYYLQHKEKGNFTFDMLNKKFIKVGEEITDLKNIFK